MKAVLVKREPFGRKAYAVLETVDPGGIRGMRDRAMPLPGFAGRLRLSERAGAIPSPPTSRKDGDPSIPVGAGWRGSLRTPDGPD